MITALVFLFIFGLLTVFHELGHFIVAKKTGILVEEFGIGFGPRLWSKQWGETMYSMRLFPLGGFVKMLGQDDPDQAADKRAFDAQSPFRRLLVVGAGPAMNFILAMILFALIFFVMGTPVIQAEIGGVIPGSPAWQAGIEPGDKIVAIDDAKIQSWDQIPTAVALKADQLVEVSLLREGTIVTVELKPQISEETGRSVIGIERAVKKGQVLGALSWGARQTIDTARFIFERVGQMIVQRQATDISGPVGIVRVVDEVAHTGIINILSLTAILSINLGVFNLFPIPVLDGGQIVMIGWEGIRGKKLGPEQEGAIRLIGVLLLLVLLVMATYQDLRRICLGV